MRRDQVGIEVTVIKIFRLVKRLGELASESLGALGSLAGRSRYAGSRPRRSCAARRLVIETPRPARTGKWP